MSFLHPALQESLENIAQNLPHFVSRSTQHQMMNAVFKTLSQTLDSSELDGTCKREGESILVIEGPTGTGKSLAYLIPAIIAANLHKKHLVISSATVMLQEQLANKDIPFVTKHAGLSVTYVIAKGRGRYACPHKLYQYVHQGIQSDFIGYTSDELPPVKKLTKHEITQLNALAHRLHEKTWSGDKDELAENLPDALWSSITNDRHGCLKRECQYYKECPFYQARDKLEQVDMIIANHDLLLADLAMGGGVILPSPEDTFYCLDEAHHLSDKAIQQFAAAHSLVGSIAWLEKLYATINKSESLLNERASAKKAQDAIERIRETFQSLTIVLENLLNKVKDNIYRFPHGVLPEGFDIFGTQILPAVQTLLSSLRQIQDALKRKKTKPENKSFEKTFERLVTDLGFFVGRVENIQAVWTLFSTEPLINQPPVAKWITRESVKRGQIEYILSASPVRASQLLTERLWQKAAGCVLTSATLRSLGSFEKLLHETGLNQFSKTTCTALPSPFDLPKQGSLAIPKMKTDPKNSDAHTQEISALLPNLISLEKKEGTLVLFSSKKQMQEVAAAIPKRWQDMLLIQGNAAKEVLLKTHFNRIANHEPSILFGLASFAEGLDLPGKACTHLIIAKLPFSMPDDPVSQTLAEWVTLCGGNPFFEITLPQASTRLIQAVGRLIRSETDTGVVTILDNRLLNKSYGQRLKKDLPPFKEIF